MPLGSDHANELADDTITRSAACARPPPPSASAASSASLVAMVYTCLYAMRVGLLTRFWGSLGMALGVVVASSSSSSPCSGSSTSACSLGWLPADARPPGQPGEAIPWPTPGEKAAADLAPEARRARDPRADESEATPKGQPQ